MNYSGLLDFFLLDLTEREGGEGGGESEKVLKCKSERERERERVSDRVTNREIDRDRDRQIDI